MYSMTEDKGAVRGGKVGRPRKHANRSERQAAHVENLKRKNLKEIRAYVSPEVKKILLSLCESTGTTQSELLSELLVKFAECRN